MRPDGFDCKLAVVLAGCATALPYTDETLRGTPIVETDEPLLGRGTPVWWRRCGERASGCFVTRIGARGLGALLRICLGEVDAPVHVAETRGMFSSVSRLAEGPDGLPFFDVLMDRVVERVRYGGLKTRGFELRALVEEPLYLRVDVEGSDVTVAMDAIPELVDEEHFFFERGDVTIDGKVVNGVYGFSVAVGTGLVQCAGGRALNGEKRVSCTLYAALDEEIVRMSGLASHDIELRFKLVNTFPEPNRAPELVVKCEKLLLRKEQKEADSAGEMCSPYVFVGRGALTATFVNEGNDR